MKTHSKLTAPAQPANIKFIGKGTQQEPLTRIRNGSSTYVLPSTVAEQRRGFYHENAKEICALFGNYKMIVRKGKK